MTRTLVNQSYSMQLMTGQQRYATEISARLLSEPDFVAIGPDGYWAGSTARVWAWLQFMLPRLQRGSTLLSMTSRAPMFRRRQVIVVHDLFVLTHPEWFSRKYVLTHAGLLRAQIKRAAAIVAVSEPVAREVSRMYSGPVAIAPNAASAPFTRKGRPSEDAAVLKSHALTDGSYFLAVGSLDPRKNLLRLAEAYGMLSDEERAASPLVVVGAANSIYRDQSIAWPSGTLHVGYLPDEELRALYAHSRAVVFASLAEGFGLPLVEAAAAGAPSLVISDIPVFRWICGTGAIYVDPGSASSIAAGLRDAVSRPISLFVDLTRFTWDGSASVVRETCRSISGGTP